MAKLIYATEGATYVLSEEKGEVNCPMDLSGWSEEQKLLGCVRAVWECAASYVSTETKGKTEEQRANIVKEMVGTLVEQGNFDRPESESKRGPYVDEVFVRALLDSGMVPDRKAALYNYRVFVTLGGNPDGEPVYRTAKQARDQVENILEKNPGLAGPYEAAAQAIREEKAAEDGPIIALTM